MVRTTTPTDYKKIEEIVDKVARKRSTVAIVISITMGLLSIMIKRSVVAFPRRLVTKLNAPLFRKLKKDI